MTFPSPGPATQSTGNVAGGPYGAWSGTGTTALIGPAGVLVPFGGGGVALYDGVNSITSGTAVFSDANGVSFGINGQTITASANAGGVILNAGANSVSSGTAIFSNLNGVTFGINGQTITASVAAVGGAQTGISSIADSVNTQTVGMLSFANSQGVTFGLSTGAATATLTASVAAQTVQTQTAGNIAQTGFATTTTNGVVIVGTNVGGVTLAVPPYITTYVAQTTQTQAAGNIMGTGFATTTTNGVVIVGTNNTAGQTLAVPAYITTYVAGLSAIQVSGSNTSSNLASIAFSNLHGVTFGLSTAAGLAGTITASVAAAGGAQTGISSIADGAGTQTVGMLSFANSNGMTFGLSTGALTATLTASYSVPSTAGLISAINVSAGTTSNNITAITFANGSGVSFGLSTNAGGPIGTITASVAAQTNQTLGFYALGNTTSSLSSGTFDARSMSFNATGPISVGYSAGSIVLSAATVAGQTSGGMYVTGNTTNNSSTTLPMSSWLWNAQGAQTIGFSNGSIQLSVPATSSLVGTNGISVSTNGSTISVSAINESIYITGNTTGQSSSSYYVPGALTISAGAGISIGWSNGSLIISA